MNGFPPEISGLFLHGLGMWAKFTTINRMGLHSGVFRVSERHTEVSAEVTTEPCTFRKNNKKQRTFSHKHIGLFSSYVSQVMFFLGGLLNLP